MELLGSPDSHDKICDAARFWRHWEMNTMCEFQFMQTEQRDLQFFFLNFSSFSSFQVWDYLEAVRYLVIHTDSGKISDIHCYKCSSKSSKLKCTKWKLFLVLHKFTDITVCHIKFCISKFLKGLWLARLWPSIQLFEYLLFYHFQEIFGFWYEF